MREATIRLVEKELRQIESGYYPPEILFLEEDGNYFTLKTPTGLELVFFIDALELDYLEKMTFSGETLEYECRADGDARMEPIDDGLDMDAFEALLDFSRGLKL